MDPFVKTAVLLESQLHHYLISKMSLKKQLSLWRMDIFSILSCIVSFPYFLNRCL